MKKKILFILMPVFMVACLLMLASCDAYGGNYKEVTGEELTAVETKLQNCTTEVETKKENYEANISATVKVSSSGGTTEAVINATTLYDRSNENSASMVYYSKYDMKITAQNKNLNISSETWSLTDGTVYIKASMNGSADGKSINTSIAKKGSISKLSLNADFMAIQSAMSTFAQALSQANAYIDLSEIVQGLNDKGVKVYTAGDNKIKIEATEGDVTMTFFIIVNSNNTYQMKFEMPETKMGGVLSGMTMKETLEMKPTSAKVTAPSGNFEEV